MRNNFLQFTPYVKPRQYKQLKQTQPTNYTVQACENWKPLNPNLTFFSTGFDTYTVFNVTETKTLYEDPRVIEFQVWNPPEPLVRYTSGYLQSRANYLEYEGNYLVVPRTLHKKGLTGKGQIVSVIDSGVDYNHDFFYDPKYPEIDIIENPNHRKIYKIAATWDNDRRDVKGGHGTHVCGILAGKSLKNDSATGQYNGVAPDAKIHMTDVSPSVDGEEDHLWGIGYINLPTTLRSLSEYHNIGVNSNSWGAPYTHKENYEYDRIGYETDDLLVVFGAGNYGSQKLSILTPATSKNVLTVGNSFQPGVASVEDNRYRTITLVLDNGEEITATQEANSLDLVNVYTPVSSFFHAENKPTGFQVIKTYGDNFCEVRDEAINNGAKIFIFGSEDGCPHKPPPKPAVLLRVGPTSYAAERIKQSKFITIKLNSTVDKPLTYAPETSSGPGYNFVIKPDISAPGNLITSANGGGYRSVYNESATNRENLITYSGTSMATPAISGCAAILRQFFMESGYNSTPIKPKSALLRAALINSAIRCAGDDNTYHQSIRTGFGIPYLEAAVGMAENGIFYINNERILSNGHRMFTITTTKQMDLTVALAYVDKPIDDEAYPLFAYIHIFIEDSYGKTYTENMHEDGRDDYLTTNKKVIVKNAPPGKYNLHIYASNFDPTNTDKIHYSLSVFGGFDTNNKDAVIGRPPTCPMKCNNMCDESKRCLCDDSHTGTLCNTEVGPLPLNTSVTGNVDVYTTAAFKLKAKAGQKFKVSSNPGQMILLCAHAKQINSYNRNCHYGFSTYNFITKVTENTDFFVTFNALTASPVPISVTVTEDFTPDPTPYPTLPPIPQPDDPNQQPENPEEKPQNPDQKPDTQPETNNPEAQDSKQNKKNNQSVVIGVSVGVVLAVVVAVVAVVAFFLLKKKREIKAMESGSEDGEVSYSTSNIADV